MNTASSNHSHQIRYGAITAKHRDICTGVVPLS